jgi:acyl carrier protein
MNLDELQAHILECLIKIAPEADTNRLKWDVSLRDQLDLDSMDFLNFVIALHKRLSVEIPERDYPKLSTVKGCTDYLAEILSVRDDVPNGHGQRL